MSLEELQIQILKILREGDRGAGNSGNSGNCLNSRKIFRERRESFQFPENFPGTPGIAFISWEPGICVSVSGKSGNSYFCFWEIREFMILFFTVSLKRGDRGAGNSRNSRNCLNSRKIFQERRESFQFPENHV